MRAETKKMTFSQWVLKTIKWHKKRSTQHAIILLILISGILIFVM
ncbi:hypothetical protein [Peribacillus huizhouensis]|uniref:ABC transporter permease n=1 Tax=Peribacillus huizhouensis TaxID=1501239 RepID=A0ABR6CNV0_9BACI|nr:hypothetical protein [Peribacillus huizhouensis]MBA9026338.1 hypothetical protein [Peribacillus huizhouensis]